MEWINVLGPAVGMLLPASGCGAAEGLPAACVQSTPPGVRVLGSSCEREGAAPGEGTPLLAD